MRKILIGLILTIAFSVGVIGMFVIFTEGSDGYVGLTLEEAVSKARFERTPLRVVERDDGEPIGPLTDDFRPDRANISIENGKVVSVEFY